MNDPLCYFLGTYDRESVLSGRWTGVPYVVKEENELFLKLKFNASRLPTIGANGFLIRRSEIEKSNIGDYLFDIDVLTDILEKEPEKLVAKVKVGIVHIFSGNIKSFFLKQRRRILDYKHFKAMGLRTYKWSGRNKGLIYFSLSCILIFPLVLQSIKGYFKKRDAAWFLHLVLCIITFYVYIFGFLTGRGMENRKSWQK